MNQGLIWLADNLRVSYGGALLQLAQMIVRASALYPLQVRGEATDPLDATAALSLRWPRWYPPDAPDRMSDATTLTTLVQGGLLSRETAVKSISDVYDIDDLPAELARIDAEQATEMKASA
jgi:hypothetical protein